MLLKIEGSAPPCLIRQLDFPKLTAAKQGGGLKMGWKPIYGKRLYLNYLERGNAVRRDIFLYILGIVAAAPRLKKGTPPHEPFAVFKSRCDDGASNRHPRVHFRGTFPCAPAQSAPM